MVARAEAVVPHIGELSRGCRAPQWVEDRAKYRDMCRHFTAETRKAGVSPDQFDFDQEIYDDRISRTAIKKKVRELVVASASEPETKRRLSEEYEARIEIPEKELTKLRLAAADRDAADKVAEQIAGCYKGLLSVCKRSGRVELGVLRKEVNILKKNCTGDFKGILRKQLPKRRRSGGRTR